MKTEADARRLAQALVDTGTHAGKEVIAILTDMGAPLGLAVGNANETREALLVLHGQGPADLHECTMVLAEEMLLIARRVDDRGAARLLLEGAIASGAARAVMERMVAAQGGDPRVVAEPDRLVVAPAFPVLAGAPGFVAEVDPLEIGLSAVALGAGRTRADQTVDPAVGIMIVAKPGARVEPGAELAVVQARDASHAELVMDRVRRAFVVRAERPAPRALVLGRVEAAAAAREH
jgi:thymidine phosphorylase